MEPSPAQQALALITGYRGTQLVRVACALRIPDLVAAGLNDSDELAQATGVDATRLRRFLRGLVGLGVLVETSDGRYRNSDVGEVLRENVPGSARPLALHLPVEGYRAWEYLEETLRTGRTGFSIAFDREWWAVLQADPDAAARFNAAMVAGTEGVATFVAANVDYSGASVIVDVGGGTGALATGILLEHPHLQGVVCDRPAGLTETRDYLTRRGVGERCRIVAADFFVSIPEGGDVYLLKSIVHDWDDERASRILATCRRAMRPGARIILVERVLPARATDGPVDRTALMLDLHMLVVLGGRERTETEYRELLESVGFRFRRSVVGERFGLVEAVAV